MQPMWGPADKRVPPPRPSAVALPKTPPEPGSSREQTRSDLPAMPSEPPPTSIAAGPPHARIAEARHNEATEMTTGTATYANSVDDETPAMKKTEQIVVAEAAPAAAAAPRPP